METPEYAKLLAKVDAQLDAAKRDWEEKAWKIQFEQKLKLIDHQTGELQKREEAFVRFGTAVPLDLAQAIERLRAEKAQVQEGLKPKSAPAPNHVPAPAPALIPLIAVPAADQEEMRLLLQEIVETELSTMGAEEKWTLFEIWALRWRVLSERIGQDAVQQSSIHKKTYRFIREKMETSTACWYIDCLNPAKSADWAANLAHCQRALTKLAVERTDKPPEPVDLAGQAMDELFAYLGSPAPEGKSEEEWLRSLRHLTRSAARYHHMRDEVAEVVKDYRSVLEPEFAFLWKNGQDHPELREEETRKLSNRTIVTRLLRKLRSKGLIGGSHGPYEGVVNNGFPGHDLERSKRAMELLIKSGVVKSKPTNYGLRISLDQREVARTDGFLNGQPLGIQLVDEWIG